MDSSKIYDDKNFNKIKSKLDLVISDLLSKSDSADVTICGVSAQTYAPFLRSLYHGIEDINIVSFPRGNYTGIGYKLNVDSIALEQLDVKQREPRVNYGLEDLAFV